MSDNNDCEFLLFLEDEKQLDDKLKYLLSEEFNFKELLNPKFLDIITFKNYDLLLSCFKEGYFNVKNNDEKKEIKFRKLNALYILILMRLGIKIIDIYRGYCDISYNFDLSKLKGETDKILYNLKNEIKYIIIEKNEIRLSKMIILTRIIRTLPYIGHFKISQQLTNHLIKIYNEIEFNENDGNEENILKMKKLLDDIIQNGRIRYIKYDFNNKIDENFDIKENEFKTNINIHSNYDCTFYQIKSNTGKVIKIGVDDKGYLKNKNKQSYFNSFLN